ncbi:MAG: hypothetical protein HYX68_26410 [Planctomycetes bacterium]|nr:hypothetical protein [Planctomycetota bacterium]
MSIFSFFKRSILADLLENLSKAAKARGRFRPRVETLEDRLAPAAFMVALTGNDADPFGVAGGSYRTIQAAVNAAAAVNDGDDFVNVATGTYNTAGVDARFDIPASANLQNLQMLGGWNAAFTLRKQYHAEVSCVCACRCCRRMGWKK